MRKQGIQNEKKSIIIIGASGHGKVVADIAMRKNYEKICFLDDNVNLCSCSGYPVVGRCEDFAGFDCDFIVAIGNPETRQRVMNQLKNSGKHIASLIHPNAVIGQDVDIGIGTVVTAGTVISPGARIGQGCIVNTCASVDHDCILEDFVHIAVGAHVAGTSEIGKRTWVGAGAIVSNDIRVCGDCMIGAGAVVVNDIKESGTYVGCPAKRMK